MKNTKIVALIGIVTMLALSVGGAGAQGPSPGGDETNAIVAAAISYQGRLTDPAGTPLSGTYDLEFTFWSAETTPPGVQLGGDDTRLAQVITNGLYSAPLKVPLAYVDGRELWLRIQVRETGTFAWETLSPRIRVVPTAYALSLRPGAQIQGEPTAWDGWVLKVNMYGTYPLGKAVLGSTATGSAVHGDSTGGWGVYGYTEDGYAIRGYDGGTADARGYGGYFTSDNGVGVYGYSSATDSASNYYTPGVYGRSANGVGVYGLSHGSRAGVRGESAAGYGVEGISENDIGVHGKTNGTSFSDYGVYGTGDGLAYGVYGHQLGTTSGLGVYGKNEGGGSGVSGYNAGDGNGTWGYSVDYNGVGGMTGRIDNNYGLYTADNLYSANYHLTGAVMQVVQNGDTETLERGDVVVVAGMGKSLVAGGTPVVQVQKARAAGSTGVIGIVASTYSSEWLQAETDPTGATAGGKDIPLARSGPIAPSEYLLVVVQGVAQVKADAVAGAIQPGDLLSSAGEAGHATRAATVRIESVSTAMPGTVLGKALEPLDKGQKLIYVFVTLQ